MKKILMTVLSIMMFYGMSNAADESTSMKSVTQQGDAMITYFEDEKDLEVVRIEYDLIFADNAKTLTRYFSKDYTYYIMGFADDRVKDLDLELYRKSSSGEWELVEKDTEVDSTPVLIYSVPQSGEYMIRIKAPSFVTGNKAAHYGLIVAHD